MSEPLKIGDKTKDTRVWIVSRVERDMGYNVRSEKGNYTHWIPKEHAEVLPSGGDEREKAVKLVREMRNELIWFGENACDTEDDEVYEDLLKRADKYIKGGK